MIATLSARPAWALALLDAVGNKTIPRRDLNATVARQLRRWVTSKVRTRLEAVWGSIRPTSNEKTSLIAKYKNLLATDQHRPPTRGEAAWSSIGPATSATSSSIAAAMSDPT